MGYLRQDNLEEASLASDRNHWLRAARGAEVTPELEDARRRFTLALRALTARREKEEQDRAVVEEWAETLEREIRVYRKWRFKRRMRWLFAGTVLLVSWLAFHKVGNFWIYWWLIAGGAAADAAAGSRYQAASKLARARDPRAVSVLAVACRDGDAATRAVAARGLESILPRLQAGDAQHIMPEGMDALIGLLRSPDTDLVIAILNALEQVGDARALPAVERVLTSRVAHGGWGYHVGAGKAIFGFWSPDRGDRERVRGAARQCLPYLQARAEQERLRNTLLRPAQAPDDPAATLLRPAGAAPTTPPEQLLRPVE